MPTLSPASTSTIRQIGPTHDAARLYSRARRNLLPRDQRLVAVSGRWQHEHLLRLGIEPVVTLRCGPADPAVVAPGGERATYAISEKTLARLHPGLSAPALLSVVCLPAWRPEEVLRPDARLVLVADGIEYAGNLGTLVRTADAAGADGLVLTNPHCRLTHPKVFEASRGTVLTLPVVSYETVAEARRHLTAAGFTAYVADPAAAVDYLGVDYSHQKVALVVGSEGAGVAAGWRTPDLTRVSIPMRGRADSLNVAASASVLLFDARARLG
jgi:TrmH family RNA methyltransferase